MNDDDPLHLYQKFTESFNKIARNGETSEGMTGTPGVYQNLDLDMQYPAPLSQVHNFIVHIHIQTNQVEMHFTKII